MPNYTTLTRNPHPVERLSYPYHLPLPANDDSRILVNRLGHKSYKVIYEDSKGTRIESPHKFKTLLEIDALLDIDLSCGLIPVLSKRSTFH